VHRRGRPLATHADIYAIERSVQCNPEAVLERPTAMPRGASLPWSNAQLCWQLLRGVAGPQATLEKQAALIFRNERGVQIELFPAAVRGVFPRTDRARYVSVHG